MDAMQKREVLEGLSGNLEILHRMKLMLKDVCSNTKRAIRDCLLKTVEYTMLLSGSAALATDQI